MTDTTDSFDDFFESAVTPAARAEQLAAEATQVQHPWRATFRTFVAAVVPLLVLVPAIMPVLVDWANENATVLPAWVAPALVGAAAIVAAIAGGITKVFAIPGVEVWLREHLGGLFAAAPRA